jgi:hypothetical protein
MFENAFLLLPAIQDERYEHRPSCLAWHQEGLTIALGLAVPRGTNEVKRDALLGKAGRLIYW